MREASSSVASDSGCCELGRPVGGGARLELWAVEVGEQFVAEVLAQAPQRCELSVQAGVAPSSTRAVFTRDRGVGSPPTRNHVAHVMQKRTHPAKA